jgi:hypothetical protein
MNNCERWSSNSQRRKENHSDQTNIHGDLELNKLSDILEKGSSPHDGMVDRKEIIIQDNKMSFLFGN